MEKYTLDTQFNALRVEKYMIANDRFLYLSEGCTKLNKSGYKWMFDIIGTALMLPKVSCHFAVVFSIEKIKGQVNVVCRSLEGDTVFSILMPYLSDAENINIYVEDDTVSFDYEKLQYELMVA